MLLDRDTFRNAVLKRDGYKCIICGYTDSSVPDCGLNAHHVIERRLWDDSGYYLDNGATLCDDHNGIIGCHKKAEMTTLPCDQIRHAAGITTIHLPEHLYTDYEYDKWSNIIHADGSRTKGELFNDESVQKVLEAGGVLPLFRKYIKYPRTFHLPWSCLTDDDRMLPSTTVFEDRQIVITEKMDGENTTMYDDHIHARSLDTDNHESRSWVKQLHAKIRHDLTGFRICGENLYALHSIPYSNLPSYFLVFSIWDESNMCLSWDDTVEYAGVLGLQTVPVIWQGMWDEEKVRSFVPADTSVQEGYVVRVADSFTYGSFRKSIAKWVRPHHVQTTHGWKQRAVVKNGLRTI